VQKTGNYKFDFDYDWSVLASVPGSLALSSKLKSHTATAVAVKAIAEIFDKNSQLVGDNNEVIFKDFFVPIPLLNPDKAQAGTKTLTMLNVPLDKRSPPSPYRWRFSVTAIAMAWAAGAVVDVRSICLHSRDPENCASGGISPRVIRFIHGELVAGASRCTALRVSACILHACNLQVPC
jgi:hypothetical protein